MKLNLLLPKVVNVWYRLRIKCRIGRYSRPLSSSVADLGTDLLT